MKFNKKNILVIGGSSGIGLELVSTLHMAKAGLEGFATALSAESATHQIRVNVVSPSLTYTAFSANLLSSGEKRQASAKRHPFGHFGTAADISSDISFFLSKESSWITGQVLAVDGGIGSIRNF